MHESRTLIVAIAITSVTLISLFGLYKLSFLKGNSNGKKRRKNVKDCTDSYVKESSKQTVSETERNARTIEVTLRSNKSEHAENTGHKATGFDRVSAPCPSTPPAVEEPIQVATVVQKESGDAELRLLVQMLDTTDEAMLHKVLVTIGNAAAFTHNQNVLREAGCLAKLSRLLLTYNMAAKLHDSAPCPRVVNGIANTINNLSMNECNQAQLQECIPTLIDFAASEKSSESVQLASLQALTNLSVTSKYHLPYTQVIQQLYGLLDTGTNSLKLQAMKILVNLSCNADMVPHLLAAKAPRHLLVMLSPECEDTHLLRWTTVLANILTSVKDNDITSGTLPCEYKAASPETMFSALFGVHCKAKLKSKVFLLSRHDNEEVKNQASRMYSVLSD